MFSHYCVVHPVLQARHENPSKRGQQVSVLGGTGIGIDAENNWPIRDVSSFYSTFSLPHPTSWTLFLFFFLITKVLRMRCGSANPAKRGALIFVYAIVT